MQCMVTAMGSIGAANGVRSWLAQRRPHWLTPRRQRYVTVALFAIAVLVAATMSGSS
jgi:hypothetical protein